MDLHIHLHHHFDNADVGILKDMHNLLLGLKAQLGALMALSQEIKDLTAKIDQATNAVATRLDNLAAQIHNSMTDAEVADIKAGLQAEVDRLTALGQDPANPVPPAPPVVP